jgi:hypothetical protein
MTLRTAFALFSLTAAATLTAARPASAQAPCACQRGSAGYGGAVDYSSGYSSATVSTGSAPVVNPTAAPGVVRPYSYYAAPAGVNAREYVPYGPTDNFPFHGRPYGHPTDRWSWQYMSTNPSGPLAHYYYPPLG